MALLLNYRFPLPKRRITVNAVSKQCKNISILKNKKYYVRVNLHFPTIILGLIPN